MTKSEDGLPRAVYTVRSTDGSFLLICQDLEDYSLLSRTGREAGRASEPWVAIRVERSVSTCDPLGLETDAPDIYPGMLALSDRALGVLEPMLSTQGTLLGLEAPPGQGSWSLFVPRIVDALDVTNSEGLRDGADLTFARSHVFLPEALAGVSVFKLPGTRGGGGVYVGQEFVDAFTGSDLVGLRFARVWTEGLPPLDPKWPWQRGD